LAGAQAFTLGNGGAGGGAGGWAAATPAIPTKTAPTALAAPINILVSTRSP
jgi:hypothetical protein